MIGTLWKLTFSSFRNSIFQNLVVLAFWEKQFSLFFILQISTSKSYRDETLLKFSVRVQILWKIVVVWLYNIRILLPNLQKLLYLHLVCFRVNFDDWNLFNTEKSEKSLQTIILILLKSQNNKILKYSISEARKCGLSDDTNHRPRQFFLVLSWLLSSVSRLSKIGSVHTYVMLWTVYFGWICI